MRINICRKQKTRGLFPCFPALWRCRARAEGGLGMLAGGSGLGLAGTRGYSSPGKMCEAELPSRAWPSTPGQGHLLSASQDCGDSIHSGDPCFTPEPPGLKRPLLLRAGRDPLQTHPQSGAGCHSAESPMAGGHRHPGTGASHSTVPMAPPAMS